VGAVGLERVVGTLAAGPAMGREGDRRVDEQLRRPAQGCRVSPTDRAERDFTAVRLDRGAGGRTAVDGANPRDFRNAADWREWLKRNHAKSQGEWVYMYKKGAKVGLRYHEALDEALCFGWIDGQIHAVDEEKFRQRWTPRRKGSIWSQVNKAKVKRLMAEGKMTESGRAAVRAAKRCGKWQAAYTSRTAPELPADLRKALKSVAPSWINFSRFAPSYRAMYIGWVADAKQPETRQRRIAAVVRRARENLKPGMSSLYE
jgi:uncharacterized protein YdeI (YjbR/CyaY-like superfamily)